MKRLPRVRPAITRIVSAADALGLSADQLLHAGPPLSNPRCPPAPIASAAALTLCHEGRATSLAEADALITSGQVRLEPAQPHACVTPLAAVIGPRTPLFELMDTGGLAAPSHAPVSTLHGPDTRFGQRDPKILERLADRDRELVDALRRAIGRAGPIALLPLAVAGLAGGDDLHNRTNAANSAFADCLRAAGEGPIADAIDATPLFFLTPWMAACYQMLSVCGDRDCPSLVVRAGGNGEVFGITLGGQPNRWISQPAGPPRGPLLAHADPAASALGAIGDSALIDLIGFGAQRLPSTPIPFAELGDRLPAGFADRIGAVFGVRHDGFDPPVPLGIDARLVFREKFAPVVTLAMLAADGHGGLLGRGMYAPGVELFVRALDSLEE